MKISCLGRHWVQKALVERISLKRLLCLRDCSRLQTLLFLAGSFRLVISDISNARASQQIMRKASVAILVRFGSFCRP